MNSTKASILRRQCTELNIKIQIFFFSPNVQHLKTTYMSLTNCHSIICDRSWCTWLLKEMRDDTLISLT